MAIETKEDAEEDLEEELKKKAFEAAARRAGPLDRAPELFFLMSAPTVYYFIHTNNDDILFLSVIIGCFVLLAFVGGAITNVGIQLSVNTAALESSKKPKEETLEEKLEKKAAARKAGGK